MDSEGFNTLDQALMAIDLQLCPILRRFYLQLGEEGFSEAQALRMTCVMLAAVIGKAGEEDKDKGGMYGN